MGSISGQDWGQTFASYLALSQTGATGAAKGLQNGEKTGKLEDQLFSLLDKNSDGSVNRSDFEALLQKSVLASEKTSSMFFKLDENNDASVSKVEFTNAIDKHREDAKARFEALRASSSLSVLTELMADSSEKPQDGEAKNQDMITTLLNTILGTKPSSPYAAAASGQTKLPFALGGNFSASI